MDDVTEVILGEDEAIEEQQKSFVIASVASIGSNGVTLKFDESDTAGEKEYRGNTNQKLAVGDRVFAAADSGTYVILCKIGKPGSDYPPNYIPSNGNDGQLLAKNGSTNYSLKWVDPPSNSIPTGGSDGQLLAKNGSANYSLKWVNAPSNPLPTGGSAGNVLMKNSATNYDVKWGSMAVSEIKNGSYSLSMNSSGVITPNFNGYIDLGSTYYQLRNLYASGTIQLGNSYSGSVMICSSTAKLGFFGVAPVSRKSLYATATLSDLITALKGYGLFN